MKEIALTQGKFAIVDDEDFEDLAKFKWAYHGGYAHRVFIKDGKKTGELMHRVIVNAPAGMDIDHVNRNPLDNRKCNLRVATRSQNNANKAQREGSFKGACWRPIPRRWKAYIKVDHKQIHLGYFSNAVDAAKAYNAAALKYFGEFARLNVIPEGA